MSDLVGNPKDRFSHVAAHFILEKYRVTRQDSLASITSMAARLDTKVIN